MCALILFIILSNLVWAPRAFLLICARGMAKGVITNGGLLEETNFFLFAPASNLGL